MYKKRIMAIVISAIMVFSVFSTTVFAEETSADSWDGTADTSWYQDSISEFHLTAAEQLAGLAELVNNDIRFEGKTVYLDQNIDLAGHEWISIGSGANVSSNAFCGIFDGQGHVITNLYSHEDYISSDPNKTAHNTIRTGLFGAVYQGTIQNLGVTNADIYISENDTSTYGMGIIADWFTKSTMINCYSTGKITGGSYIEKYIGGLVGFANGDVTIKNCYSQAVITGNYTNSGNYYSDSMSYWDSLGGILGASYTGIATLTDCWFDGEIIVNSIQAPVGGIAGYTENAVINNCLVATSSIGSDGLGNTFWVAYETFSNVQNCIYPDNSQYGSTPINEEQGVSAGMKTNDFNSNDVLNSLKTNAGAETNWIKGIYHPTFANDDNNILADYQAVEAAEQKIPTDLSVYTDESVNTLNTILAQISYDMSKAQQQEVDTLARMLENAIAGLVYKNADYSKVDEAIAKANALSRDEYKDFSGVDAAINSVVRNKNITQQDEVDAMAQAIEDAIAALEKKEEIPVNPTEPTTPGDSGTINGLTEHGSGEQGMNSPQTGDNSNTVIWVTVAILAAGAMMGTFVVARKRKSE